MHGISSQPRALPVLSTCTYHSLKRRHRIVPARIGQSISVNLYLCTASSPDLSLIELVFHCSTSEKTSLESYHYEETPMTAARERRARSILRPIDHLVSARLIDFK